MYFRQSVVNTIVFTLLAVAFIFRMMLSPNYGIITQVFTSIGLPVYNWFYDVKTAFGTILLIDIWQNVPFVFLLIYARLQTVPEDQYQAAGIDGAGAVQKFFHITLPNISGGPANSTSTITQFMYTYGIKTFKFGFASACAIVMTILVLILSGFYIRKAMR